ncbi:type III-A CRISPR-associated protein Csm2 [Desulfoglaeba alkanexedens]|uniref:CRISPR system Cms protein Csm2 n=1 Tax=Desulfoglaeba alkanexedens ALDC TaxID=980445 RepID=A0A4V1ERY1_9BACT|nr:type III-A CRISPR-associated protein Csm2 [Desulfoglaeba alkanexedens]QCQ23221.1 type III-A CRISPR-associated protein Csm2 [Desulfoglaeba alkanexedens ALDC]
MNGSNRNPQPRRSGGQVPKTGDGGNQLPVGRPIRYFQDAEKKKLDPSLVDEKARDWARSFSSRLKSTQMRRFYDEFKAIERKILQGNNVQEHQSNFERDLALIRLFKAKAVYAEKRNVAPRDFTQFIFDHMVSIQDVRDFQAFMKVFEAVVAFHRFYAQDN